MNILKRSVLLLLLLSCIACHKKQDKEQDIKAAGTPVTVTAVTHGSLSETITLNASSAFLLKTPVKSLANGYLRLVNIKQGDYVKKGQVLMTIITKESQSIGNTISAIDSSFHFNGQLAIKASGNGYISQLNFQAGDYVQDGELLAVISDASSFVFLLELPYELNAVMRNNKQVQLLLPDGTTLQGTVKSALAILDSVSQTQRYVIDVKSDKLIPENLVARVSLIKNMKANADILPREAILTDETQSEFWVMQLINDSTAVKIPVTTGIGSGNKVEIISPHFAPGAQILVSGNYGLPDTASVKINNRVR